MSTTASPMTRLSSVSLVFGGSADGCGCGVYRIERRRGGKAARGCGVPGAHAHHLDHHDDHRRPRSAAYPSTDLEPSPAPAFCRSTPLRPDCPATPFPSSTNSFKMITIKHSARNEFQRSEPTGSTSTTPLPGTIKHRRNSRQDHKYASRPRTKAAVRSRLQP